MEAIQVAIWHYQGGGGGKNNLLTMLHAHVNDCGMLGAENAMQDVIENSANITYISVGY